jgi:hypothetical protein
VGVGLHDGLHAVALERAVEDRGDASEVGEAEHG